MMMIEISESKVEKMSDYAEKMLRYGGKLMQCLEDVSEGEGMGQREYDEDDYGDDDMGERGGYGRGGYVNRGGYGGGMGQRRGVRGTGRYSRYR